MVGRIGAVINRRAVGLRDRLRIAPPLVRRRDGRQPRHGLEAAPRIGRVDPDPGRATVLCVDLTDFRPTRRHRGCAGDELEGASARIGAPDLAADRAQVGVADLIFRLHVLDAGRGVAELSPGPGSSWVVCPFAPCQVLLRVNCLISLVCGLRMLTTYSFLGVLSVAGTVGSGLVASYSGLTLVSCTWIGCTPSICQPS